MATIIVPGKSVENLRGGDGGKFVFPEGAYRGVIETTTLKGLPATATGEPFQGYTSTDGELVTLRIGSLEGMDGNAAGQDYGARKWFVDLVLSDGDQTVETIDTTAKGVAAWQLQRSAKMLANLAIALGAVKFIDDDQIAVDDGFVEALKEGKYDGTPVSFVVYHKANKKDPSAPYQEIETFLGV